MESVRAAFLAEVLCVMLGERVGGQVLEIGWWGCDREVVNPEPTGPVPAAIAVACDFIDRGVCDGESNGLGVEAAITGCFNGGWAHLVQ